MKQIHNKSKMIYLWWFFIYGVCYTMMEIPHIWYVSTTYEMRFVLPEWFTSTDKTLNWFHYLTFQTFTNSYHFFANLPKLLIAPIIATNARFPFKTYHSIAQTIITVAVFYLAFYIGRKLSVWIFITEVIK